MHLFQHFTVLRSETFILRSGSKKRQPVLASHGNYIGEPRHVPGLFIIVVVVIIIITEF